MTVCYILQKLKGVGRDPEFKQEIITKNNSDGELFQQVRTEKKQVSNLVVIPSNSPRQATN